MSDVQSLFRGTRGFFRDKGMPQVPTGFVYDLVDYVPDELGAEIRQRGAWTYRSTLITGAFPDGMVWMPFRLGPELLVAAGNNLYTVPMSGAAGLTNHGAMGFTMITNPFQYQDWAILTDGTGVALPKVRSKSAFAVFQPGPHTGKFGASYKNRVVIASSSTEPHVLWFSKPAGPLTPWNVNSRLVTPYTITGLASMRNQILVFHPDSVERVIGSTPPDSDLTDPLGDMRVDFLHRSVGCFDSRSIAYWGDFVIFADGSGVHLTDGGIVKNLCAQAGVASYWKDVFWEDLTTITGNVDSVAGTVFGDRYICTVRRGGQKFTFLFDLASRTCLARFTNMDMITYAAAGGVDEKLYGGDQGNQRIVDLTPVFHPQTSSNQVDADGGTVLPQVTLGYERLGKREAMRRIKGVYVTYTAREATDGLADVLSAEILRNHDGAWAALPGFRYASEQTRRMTNVNGFRGLGAGIRLTQLRPTIDTRISNVGIDLWDEEGHRR